MFVRFEDWTQGRAVASLGTNAGAADLPFQKWRHFKEAFTPEIVRRAITESRIPVSRCADPFGGSGTTGLACQFLGIVPTIGEVNPYLADLIEAKLCAYQVDPLVTDLARVLGRADHCLTMADIVLPPSFIEPGTGERWIFDEAIAQRILSLRAAIDELKNERHRRLLRVLLGGALLGLSNVIINGKGRRYRKGWKERNRQPSEVDLAFSDAATSAIAEINRYQRRATTGYVLLRGDSRETIRTLDPIELAVFSPPYPNSFDYTDVYNVELWMLGYMDGANANRTLRQSTLASHVQIHRNYAPPPRGSQRLDHTLGLLDRERARLWCPHIPMMLGAYFTEMLGIIEALSLALRPGGSIWAVVGDSRYAGVAINVAEILAELAQTRGLYVERIEVLREMRTSAQQGGQVQLAESLLVLGRP